jgi:hypothetical protein
VGLPALNLKLGWTTWKSPSLRPNGRGGRTARTDLKLIRRRGRQFLSHQVRTGFRILGCRLDIIKKHFMSRDLGCAAVPQQMLLDRGHAELTLGDLCCKSVGLAAQFGGTQTAVAIKPAKKSARLVGRCVAQLDLSVDPTGTNQGRIQSLRMIGREKEHGPRHIDQGDEMAAPLGVRRMITAQPFRPFVLNLVGRRSLTVTRPENAAASLDGQEMTIYDEYGLHDIDMLIDPPPRSDKSGRGLGHGFGLQFLECLRGEIRAIGPYDRATDRIQRHAREIGGVS